MAPTTSVLKRSVPHPPSPRAACGFRPCALRRRMVGHAIHAGRQAWVQSWCPRLFTVSYILGNSWVKCRRSSPIHLPILTSTASKSVTWESSYTPAALRRSSGESYAWPCVWSSYTALNRSQNWAEYLEGREGKLDWKVCARGKYLRGSLTPQRCSVVTAQAKVPFPCPSRQTSGAAKG